MSESADINNLARVTNVTVVGSKRMRSSFFAKELAAARLLQTNFRSKDEMNAAISATCSQLQARDLFHEVQATVKLPEKFNPVTRQSEPDFSSAHVRFEVKEKQVPHIIANTYIQPGTSNGVCAKVEAGFRSPWGFGEKLSIGAERSQAGTTMYNAQFEAPHIGSKLDNLSIVAMRSEDDCSFYQSFRNISDSLTASLGSRDGARQIVGTWASRDERPTLHHSEHHAYDATGGLLAVASSSTKLSLKYSGAVFDTREAGSNACPEQGSLLQGSAEIALPPGTAQFVKGEATWQHTWQLGPRVLGQAGLLCTLTGTAGLLIPFSALLKGSPSSSGRPSYSSQHRSNMKTYLVDRFSLGGPLGLRGFDPHGVGARSVAGREHLATTLSSSTNGDALIATNAAAALSSPADSLGGISKASFSAVLSVPLPFKDWADALRSVRAMAFLSVGSLGSPAFWPRWRHNRDCGHDPARGALPPLPLFGTPRVSVGGGLSMTLNGNVRLEMTYAIPLLKTKHDLVRPFQLGVGWTVG